PGDSLKKWGASSVRCRCGDGVKRVRLGVYGGEREETVVSTLGAALAEFDGQLSCAINLNTVPPRFTVEEWGETRLRECCGGCRCLGCCWIVVHFLAFR